MPGTFAINAEETFVTAFLMSAGPKLKFGEQTQDANTAGVPKWGLEVAVTFAPQDGMRPVSEVLNITITAPHDPAQGVAPGSPVQFDGFRVGVSPPEKTDRGGIRGGKLWYQASGVRAANGQHTRPKSDG
jgi:hypothetical protein